MGKGTAKKFAIGAGLAALAGYLAGILTAPKSGKETREDIKDTTKKSLSEAEKQLKKLHTELGGLIDQAKDTGGELSEKTRERLDDLLEKARDSKEKARELLSALHEGEADDKDLDRAISEATKAIDHLRSYLSK
ncbi:MAG TPA: YtxH domain-containing protein [Candidatus Saccharimonadales bacterium]